VFRRSQSKVGRTPACVKTCNSQDTMSVTWRKERSTVETNEIMKTAARRSESLCWPQLLRLLSHVLMLVLTQLVCGRPKVWTVFARSKAGIVGSNPIQGMDVWYVYVFILCLCCPVFRYMPCDELITCPRSRTVCKNDHETERRGQGPRGL
jgi:hypothetical protein